MVKQKFRSSFSLLSPALLGLIIFWGGACAKDSHRALVPLEINVERGVPEGKESKFRLVQEMRELLDRDETLRPHVEDLLALGEGELAEELQKFAEAEEFYLKSLKQDRGAAGRLAFERWASLQEKLDPIHGHNASFMAQKLLDKTQGGQESPFLKRYSLTTKTALTKRLDALIGIRLDEAPEPGRPTPGLPNPDGFPRDDIFFESRAKAVCRKPLDMRWISWVSSLTTAQRVYWNGLLLNCSEEPKRAANEFRHAMTTLSTSPEDVARVVKSAELLIQALKAVGDRVGATEAYAMQASVLKRGDLPLELLGWSPFEKQKRFIDSSYWVARNRAMQGDYQRARFAAEDGLEGIKTLEALQASPKERAIITELKVEGLHVISSRIQYEEKDFDGAIKNNQDALSIVGINKDWKERLKWSEGLYEYRKGDKAKAISALTRFLEENLEDSQRTKGLYWRGRAYFETGDLASAEKDFEELIRIAPLSFYSVVGVPTVDPNVNWQKNFKKADPEDLDRIEGFEWGVYREEPEAIRRFHRFEFAVATRFEQLLSGLGNELFEQISGKPKLLREVEPSLYATRLMHMAGQYVLSISLSASLSNANPGLWLDYPEQLLIFFPKAYSTQVVEAAKTHGLEPELVWGLARQESSFRSAVESPVGAIGLMQLMPNTALGLARAQGISTSSISARLKEPDLNLKLGTLYLADLGRRYEGKWPRAIAAYNAGEYVVDTWMQRRDVPDLVLWSEAISFGETSSYVKNVWRNWEVYRWLHNRG